ncbi:MAG: hypothetical protein ABIV06_07390, partial [Thermoanaerobaculia bacterium]
MRRALREACYAFLVERQHAFEAAHLAPARALSRILQPISQRRASSSKRTKPAGWAGRTVPPSPAIAVS